MINVNHRTRVAMERREKTRARLLKSALRVYSKHGADAKVIDQIISLAGVARGTFYNYFRNNEELFAAVAKESADEIIRSVQPSVDQFKDPAARVACGVRLVIDLARIRPVLAEFVVRGGPSILGKSVVVSEAVMRDIRDGMATGRFTVSNERLAFDLIVGPVIMGFDATLGKEVPEDYAQELSRSVLQSLGVSKAMAGKFAYQECGEIVFPQDSLLDEHDG